MNSETKPERLRREGAEHRTTAVKSFLAASAGAVAAVWLGLSAINDTEFAPGRQVVARERRNGEWTEVHKSIGGGEGLTETGWMKVAGAGLAGLFALGAGKRGSYYWDEAHRNFEQADTEDQRVVWFKQARERMSADSGSPKPTS